MNIDKAVAYANSNARLVYPTATVPITMKPPFNRPDEIILRGIQQLLDRGGKIVNGIAPVDKEPAALYEDAAYILTRASNEKRGDPYYEMKRGNLNAFAGRVYLALLRDTPPATTTTPVADPRVAKIEKQWPGLLDRLGGAA